MFIAIVVAVMILTWKFADWRNWQRYQATMLFFVGGNLFYYFVYHDHFLWAFVPDTFNHHIMEIIYSFTVYPLTVLMFLSGMPVILKKRIFHIASYIAVFASVELILHLIGRMVYDYGWNFGLSVAWNCMMFPLLAIHQKKPLIAYGICFVLIFVMNWLFPFYLA